MLIIHTVWNGVGHDVHLHPMQTYDDFVARMARTHGTHPSFMVMEGVRNLQDLLAHRDSLVVYDALPYARGVRELTVPDFSRIASEETRILLSKIFVVTHHMRREIHDQHFAMYIPHGIVRSVPDTLAEGQAVMETLRRMTEGGRGPAPLVPEVETTLPYQEMEVLHEQLSVELSSRLQDNQAARLLDLAALSEHTPHVQCRDFFKSLPGFVPSDQWVTVAADKYPDNMLMIKYNPERTGLRALNNPYQSYYEAAVQHDGSAFVSTIDIPTAGPRHVPREDCIARAYGCLSPHLTVANYTQAHLIARMQVVLDGAVEMSTFVDFVMNDPYTRMAFAVDESALPHRSRPIVYMHLMGSSQVMSLSLTSDRAVLKFRVRDLETMMFLRDCFDIMWHRYRDYRHECLAFYRLYDADPYEWGVVDEQPAVRPQPAAAARRGGRIGALRDAEPEVFINTYSRYCANMPRIVSRAEARRIVADGTPAYVMKWPRYGETTKRRYACDHHNKTKFPGVHSNRLEANKGRFPYVPCCYTVDQVAKAGSGWNQYGESGGPARQQRGAADAALDESTPPDNVRSLLGADVKFGSVRGPLLQVTDVRFPDVQRMLLDDRTRPMCYQEFSAVYADDLYIKQPAQFLQKVVGPDERFDATIFYRVVEVLRDTSVYILNRAGFVVPPNHKGHLKYAPRDGRTTLLFAFADGTYSTLEGSSYDASAVHAMFTDVCNVFAGGKRVPVMARHDGVVGQQIDRFGKCRRVRLRDGHEQYVKPCPPYAAYVDNPRATREHALRTFDNEHRDARHMLNRLRHLYAQAGSPADLDDFVARFTAPGRTTTVRNNKFYSPHIDAFMAKLRVELANGTFRDPGPQAHTYQQPNDFAEPNVFPTHGFRAVEYDHSVLRVHSTLDDTSPDTPPFMFMLDDDTMCLVQNCGDSLAKAAHVCAEWRATRRNVASSAASAQAPVSMQAQPDYMWSAGQLLQMDTRGVFMGTFATGVAVVTDIVGDQFLALLKV